MHIEYAYHVVGLAALSVFLHDCMEDGMILDWWLPGLLKARTGKPFDVCKRFLYMRMPKWLKPLGGCLYCMNFWITAAGAVLLGVPVLIPLYAGVTHVLVNIYKRFVW